MSTVTNQDVLEALYAYLVDDTTDGSFFEGVAGRIYLLEAPINANLPLAVISAIDTPVSKNYTATVRVTQWQIDLYALRSTGHEVLADVARALFDLLDEASLTVAGHDRGLVTCINDGTSFMEDDAIRIMTEWQIESQTV